MSENEGKLYDALQAFAESVMREAEKLKNFAIAFKTGNPPLVPKPSSEVATPLKTDTPKTPVKQEGVWTPKLGDNGEFELSNNMLNPAHQELHAWLKGQKDNKGFRDGYFIWLFTDGVAIGRKKFRGGERDESDQKIQSWQNRTPI